MHIATEQDGRSTRPEVIVVPLRRMPDPASREPLARRTLFLAVALALTAGYAFFLFSFWAPAPSRPGIDENAYLVAGKNIALHGTPGFKPADDFQYVGAMWVRTKDQTFEPPAWLPGFVKDRLTVHTDAGWYYPKYPAGLPLLNAVAIQLGGGGTAGRPAAFLVSPVCMALAVLGLFFLTRTLVGSFEGVLAMIVLATIPTSLELAEVPNSHAPALCFVVWGMFFLIRWWQTGRSWQGALAGLLLGFAVTLRYTEALLLFPLYPLDQVLSDTNLRSNHPSAWRLIGAARFLPLGPLGIAALLAVRWRRPASYVRAAVPIVAWTIPVAALVAFNWFSMGHLTGYDTTNESVGFSTAELLKKWDFTVHELYLFGLFLFLPLGVAGLILMFRRSWRGSLLLSLWFVPGTLLYMTYYWGMQAPGVAFLRFFLTLFPALIVAAVWLLRSAAVGAGAGVTDAGAPRPVYRSVAAPLAAGVLTAATAAVGLTASLANIERQHRGNLNLAYSAREFRDATRRAHRTPTTSATTTATTVATPTPRTPVLFADDGLFPMHLQYLQFMTDADCYAADAFEPRAGGGFGILGLFQSTSDEQKSPVLIQPDRIEYMTHVRRGMTTAGLVGAQHRVMHAAIDAGRPVYALLTPIQATTFRDLFIAPPFELTERAHWNEPCAVRFPTAQRPRGNGPPDDQRDPSPLAPRAWSGEPLVRWQPVALTLYEVRRTAAATQPTTTPTR